jgi:hypothetical protein
MSIAELDLAMQGKREEPLRTAVNCVVPGMADENHPTAMFHII